MQRQQDEGAALERAPGVQLRRAHDATHHALAVRHGAGACGKRPRGDPKRGDPKGSLWWLAPQHSPCMHGACDALPDASELSPSVTLVRPT